MNEKRRFVRIDRSIRVKYQPEESESPEGRAVSRNISANGICLLLKETLSVGTFVKLSFRLRPLSEPIETQARVVWIDSAAEKGRKRPGALEAGLEFTDLSRMEKASIASFIYESLKRRKNHL